ncbi:heme o synthase [Buchnera aphidicola]|uniref:Protoheme IX farnesyltransferase n=1 Tax=Buchnera aphidicola (Stegophylla sp.) TaxID=2315800 RepID=A0A4D6YKE9_9GAMM|nr:heme o synthase [Buchnera aphidicola (Stegophylla sp.)]QCI26444.1 protoheme IX farnesyltransferase [Buchnera aphidicola (Stegophylla sp.)]
MKNYFLSIKPGIVIANLISVLGGFCFFSSYVYINIYVLFYVVFGTGLVIASGCLFNNIIDTDIDKYMIRTRSRILLQSSIPILYFKIYGILLLLLGFSILFIKVNILSSLLSIMGFCIYVFIYSLYMKRKTIYSTIVGSLSGAIPPLVGYCSVSNSIDVKSILLFTVFILWQIPHSYSIYILYYEDYKKAKIPVFSVKKGIEKTIKEIIFYILLFSLVICLFYNFQYVNFKFIMVLSLLNIFWLCISFLCYFFKNCKFFFRLLFYFSILIICIFNIFLMLNFLQYI